MFSAFGWLWNFSMKCNHISLEIHFLVQTSPQEKEKKTLLVNSKINKLSALSAHGKELCARNFVKLKRKQKKFFVQKRKKKASKKENFWTFLLDLLFVIGQSKSFQWTKIFLGDFWSIYHNLRRHIPRWNANEIKCEAIVLSDSHGNFINKRPTPACTKPFISVSPRVTFSHLIR